MTMDKYGVSDVKAQQEQELRELKSRLRHLRSAHEKTATETQEIGQLEQRESALRAAISKQ